MPACDTGKVTFPGGVVACSDCFDGGNDRGPYDNFESLFYRAGICPESCDLQNRGAGTLIVRIADFVIRARLQRLFSVSDNRLWTHGTAFI